MPSDSLQPLKLLRASLSANPDRVEAMSETIKQLRAEYRALWAEYANAKWDKLPETWELKDDIDLALGDILDYVNSFHITSSSTSD